MAKGLGTLQGKSKSKSNRSQKFVGLAGLKSKSKSKLTLFVGLPKKILINVINVLNGFRQTYECGSVKVAYDARWRQLNPQRFPVCIITNVYTVGRASWVYSILPTQSAELFWTAMSRLTIAVHNKAGLYVHRGSLVANVPGGRREQLGAGVKTFVTFQPQNPARSCDLQ
jgi:hypothetical protein